MSRKMIAALQVSLDGFTQGSDRGGEEWVDCWAAGLELIPEVDAFVQGAGMYPGYGDYWAAIHANPHSVPPFSARLPYEREVAYAQLAARTPHYVLSKTLEDVSWPPTARIVRSLDELGALKTRTGKNIYVVGGPTLVTELLNANLLDELRLIVHPPTARRRASAVRRRDEPSRAGVRALGVHSVGKSDSALQNCEC